MKHLVLIAAVALSACSGTMVRNEDLSKHLESQGYSKVLIRGEKLNCGQFGKGRLFMATRKGGDKVLGQICYKKQADAISYKVSIRQKLGGKTDAANDNTSTKRAFGVQNPWKK